MFACRMLRPMLNRLRLECEGRVPDLQRWNAPVVAQHAEGARIEQEVAAVARGQPEPARREDPEQVPVRKQRHISLDAENSRDHPVHPCPYLGGALPAGQPSVNSIQSGLRA